MPKGYPKAKMEAKKQDGLARLMAKGDKIFLAEVKI